MPDEKDKIENFIGQDRIIDKINVLIDRVKNTNKPMPHMLFVGEREVGKKMLAESIASKLNRKITITSGFAISRVGDLIGIFTNLAEGDMLLIEDIETSPKPVVEFIYPALESCAIDFVIDKGPYAQTIKFKLKPFTLIGTTSQPEKLDKKLIKLFYSVYKFAPYTKNSVIKIIQNKAQSQGIKLDDEASKYLADVIANTNAGTLNLFDRVIKFAKLSDVDKISKNVVEDFLRTIDDTESDSRDIDRTIPEKVRLQVWRRDSGKCVKCGGQEKLEFDHIIPVSKGGSNTTRNVQLLCEKCNREKHDNIG